MFNRYEDDNYPGYEERISVREEQLETNLETAKEFLESALKSLYYSGSFDGGDMTRAFEEVCAALEFKFKFPKNEDIVSVNRVKTC